MYFKIWSSAHWLINSSIISEIIKGFNILTIQQYVYLITHQINKVFLMHYMI